MLVAQALMKLIMVTMIFLTTYLFTIQNQICRRVFAALQQGGLINMPIHSMLQCRRVSLHAYSIYVMYMFMMF